MSIFLYFSGKRRLFFCSFFFFENEVGNIENIYFWYDSLYEIWRLYITFTNLVAKRAFNLKECSTSTPHWSPSTELQMVKSKPTPSVHDVPFKLAYIIICPTTELTVGWKCDNAYKCMRLSQSCIFYHIVNLMVKKTPFTVKYLEFGVIFLICSDFNTSQSFKIRNCTITLNIKA